MDVDEDMSDRLSDRSSDTKEQLNKQLNTDDDMDINESEPKPTFDQERATRSAPLRSVSDALNSAEASSDIGICGPILPNTFRSIPRLALAIGFKSDASFVAWMNGDGFKPFYDKLQENIQRISGQTDSANRICQGPQLSNVQKAFEAGELYGKLKYTNRNGVETREFSKLDFYVLCLFHMVDYNTVSRNGAFFNKRVPISDMQQRVRQAILHANHSNAPSRKSKPHHSSKGSLGQNTQHELREGSFNGRSGSQKDTQPEPHEGSDNGRSGSHQDVTDPNVTKKPNATSSIQANWELLKSTINPTNPFDLNTRYGQYMTLHVAL